MATILNTRLVSNSCNFNQCCPVQPHRHNGELPLRHGQFHTLSNPGDGDGGVGCRRSRKREEGAAPVPDGAPGKVLLVRHDSQPQCPPLRPAQLHQGAAQQGHHHQVPGQHDLKLSNLKT